MAPSDRPALVGQIEDGVKLWSGGGLNSPLVQFRPGGRWSDGKTGRNVGVAQAWKVRSHVVRAHQQLDHLIDILPLGQELPPPIISGDQTELPEDIMANSPKAFPSP